MAPKRSAIRRAVDLAVRITDRLVGESGTVVLHSSPDLDDSIVALLRGAPAQMRPMVLAEDPGAARRRAELLGLENVFIIPRRGARGIWAFLRSTVAVSTHGLFGCFPRAGRKKTVGLWHGEFGKLIGPFADEGPRPFDWVPVSSHLSRVMRSAEFVLDPSRIHVVGSPRQNLLRRRSGLPTGGRSVVWAPTYRTSVTGLTRTDGDPASLTSVVAPDDPDLIALLEEHDVTMWYRPHPAAAQDVPGVGDRVRRATNTDLAELGLTFYELLAESVVLVTDYSSLWVDFVLLDRPMIAFCPDLDAYRSNRGLALEPHERWFPGPVTVTRNEFLAALAEALKDPSTHAQRRASIRAILHTAGDQDPVAATWAHVLETLETMGRVPA